MGETCFSLIGACTFYLQTFTSTHVHNALVAGELVKTSSYGGIRGLLRRGIPIMSCSKLLVFPPSVLRVNYVIVFFLFCYSIPVKKNFKFRQGIYANSLKSSDLHSQKRLIAHVILFQNIHVNIITYCKYHVRFRKCFDKCRVVLCFT